MNTGVVYFNTGTKCLARLAVGLFSLRDVYSGPVAVINEDGDGAEICQDICRAFDVQYVKMSSTVPDGPNRAFLQKTLLHLDAPFEHCLYLDSDTLIRQWPRDLIALSQDTEFVATAFSNLRSSSSLTVSRMNAWLHLYPAEVATAKMWGPAINAGVFCFHRSAAFMKAWYEKTFPGRNNFIPDEVAMQIWLPRFPHKVAGKQYNLHTKLNDPYRLETCILHYSGRRHCDSELLHGSDLWLNYFQRLVVNNTAHIQDWGVPGDIQLRRFSRAYRTPTVGPQALKLKVKNVLARRQITLVTAVTPDYNRYLRSTFPTWSVKPQLAGLPILIFYHGFDGRENELDYLRSSRTQLVKWSMPLHDDQRELMLSAFVLGTARHVKTAWWLKIDADAFFTNSQDILHDDYFQYDLCAPRWSKSWARHIEALNTWATEKNLPGISPLEFQPNEICNEKVRCERIISWLCLQKTAFTREVASLAGDRLPVPSHDTYMWYMAARLPYRTWRAADMKKGAHHFNSLRRIKEAIARAPELQKLPLPTAWVPSTAATIGIADEVCVPSKSIPEPREKPILEDVTMGTSSPPKPFEARESLYLFSRKGEPINLSGVYSGQGAFLILGGPSFAGIDQSRLRAPGILTMSVNNAVKSFRPNMWTCVDHPNRFLKSIWLDPTVTKFVPSFQAGERIWDNDAWVELNKTAADCPNTWFYPANDNFQADRFLTENTFNWGDGKENGGCRSVMLPALRLLFYLGIRKIFLIGCDFYMSSDHKYHFSQDRSSAAIRNNNNTYAKLIERFAVLAPLFLANGLEIYNCNTKSRLRVFPFISYDEALAICSDGIPTDIATERSFGLYDRVANERAAKR